MQQEWPERSVYVTTDEGATWEKSQADPNVTLPVTAETRGAQPVKGNVTVNVPKDGIIYGFYNESISFDLGFRSGLIAFTAAVFGGIGNVVGASLGGFIIGLIIAFSTSYTSWGLQWADVIVFSILILVLVFRPTGLLGMRVPEK